jgi:hypothetical protein
VEVYVKRFLESIRRKVEKEPNVVKEEKEEKEEKQKIKKENIEKKEQEKEDAIEIN